ncbi:hypothetical protein DK389_06665 [Methylobacterium durans]|uniref:Uncharacterized protein n=2 Tax=Methylobacterium durans TaxID=2202825 RepID=A0A2U8W3P5_9HYPH|nr:hypothetical protein DK389_06665 [Methylobacterium durans]
MTAAQADLASVAVQIETLTGAFKEGIDLGSRDRQMLSQLTMLHYQAQVLRLEAAKIAETLGHLYQGKPKFLEAAERIADTVDHLVFKNRKLPWSDR